VSTQPHKPLAGSRYTRGCLSLERETGLEPATFSLEGLDLFAVWRASWMAEHFVSSYRVILGAGAWADRGAGRGG
jgi:hypothetical protein